MADRPDRRGQRPADLRQGQKAPPLAPSIPDVPLPGGLQLGEDEFVVRTAKDWGVSISLVLTTHRLICPTDLTGRTEVSIPLTDVRDVQLRKHWVGFATIVVNWTAEPPASFPAHINGARMRADISAMADAAQRATFPKLAVVAPPATTADRYERLRQIGELRSSGVLSEAEFEQEKARILREP